MQNLRIIQENTFTKGYNDKDKPENLKEGYMADLVNCFIEENKIVKRKGYSIIGDTPVSKAILGQNRHEPSGGTKYILRARNNAGDTNAVIESWSGSGSWSALSSGSSQTASAKTEFVMASSATYIFNGSNTVGKTTNGTSMTTVAAIPIGTTARWFHNFLFVVGVSGNKSRLYFSDVNTPETFDAVNGLIDVNPGDNEDIIALGVQKDVLLIFKPTAVWGLTGYGTADFTLTNLTNRFTSLGTNALRSVVEVGNDTYYLSYMGKTPHFRSVQRTSFGELVDGGIISDDITGTMNRLVTTQISSCAGVFDGRKIWWSVCTSGTTNNEVLVYDTLTKGWTRQTGITANVLHISTISGKIQVYFGESTATAKSYVLDTTTNDNGAAIAFSVKSPLYNPTPGRKSRYKYLYVTGDVNSAVDLDVNYSPDGFSDQDLGTISLTGQGAAFGTAIFGTSKFGATTVARDRLDFAGGNAYYMQYIMSNSMIDQDLSIREWEIFYAPKPIRSIN